MSKNRINAEDKDNIIDAIQSSTEWCFDKAESDTDTIVFYRASSDNGEEFLCIKGWVENE